MNFSLKVLPCKMCDPSSFERVIVNHRDCALCDITFARGYKEKRAFSLQVSGLRPFPFKYLLYALEAYSFWADSPICPIRKLASVYRWSASSAISTAMVGYLKLIHVCRTFAALRTKGGDLGKCLLLECLASCADVKSVEE